MRIFPLLLVLALLPGCFVSRSTRHRPLDPERIASLEPGVTTAEQAVAVLGAPTEVVQLGRRSAYRYDHGVEKMAGLFLVVVGFRGVDSTEDRTWLFFGEDGVLTHVGSTLEAADARYALPVFNN